MDITPLADWLASPSNPLIIGTMLFSLAIIIAFSVMVVIYTDKWTHMVVGGTLLCVALCLTQFGISNVVKHVEKQNDAQDYVASLGFDIIEGNVAVYAGDDKTMVVSQNGETFSCTSYAPEDIEADIFFVCDSTTGQGRSSLEDLKLQLDKAVERDEAMSAATTDQ